MQFSVWSIISQQLPAGPHSLFVHSLYAYHAYMVLFFSMQATLLNYLSHYYTPQRMVLAGVGVDHDELVSLAEEHFVNQVRK